MRGLRQRSAGVTLVEMLIALVILVAVMSIVTVGLSSVLRTQATNEAGTSAQAKLRRVTEVFTQELRSAVLGGITNQPYAPDSETISFMLLDGGAGYEVQRASSTFAAETFTRIVAPVANAAETGLVGGQALLVNTNGQAVVFGVDSVSQQGGSGSVRFNVQHSTCPNTIGFTPGMLLFQVQTLGFRYDASERILYERIGANAAVPVAFDIDQFSLDYVYTEADGTPVIRSQPVVDGQGAPLREATIGGVPVTLSRIQMVIGMNSGGSVRTYSGIVELPTNQNYIIKRVRPCGS